MKKLTLTAIFALFAIAIMAQAPQGISHQAVIRDAANELVANAPIGIQVSILQGSADGTVVYSEIHLPNSNANGLITFVIGQGTVISGVFEEIDWANGPYFIKTQADPTGGTNYTIEGINQMLSVPYALYAHQTAGLDEIIEMLIDAGLYHVKDIDGNVYQVVRIGEQRWMAENLKTTHYRNGTPIENPAGTSDWQGNTTGAYAWYNNDINWKDSYGALYNWHAVNNANGLCPTGWHMPSDAEWTQLVDYMVSRGFPNSTVTNGAGNALKSCRQENSPLGGDCNTSIHPRWDEDVTHHGFDEFGFSGLPGGYRHSSGPFYYLGSYGSWWSATEFSSNNAWYRSMGSPGGSVLHFELQKTSGFSVRCLRDID